MKALLTFTITVLAAVALSAPAQAAPCWEQVVEDWADNSRVDKRYPVHCYRDALRNLPEDMRAYSSAPDDIARAMRAEIARQSREQQSSRSNPSDDGDGQAVGGSGGSGQGGGLNREARGTGNSGGEAVGTPADDPATPQAGPITEALDDLGPSDPTSVPLPLIVLGAIALTLVCAGGAGILARRFHAQRLRNSLGPRPR
jgi:hypothetical protein